MDAFQMNAFKMNAFKMNSVNPYNISKITVVQGEIWSCYPNNFTPNDSECKNIIVKIKDNKKLEIIVNSLENYVNNNLDIDNVYFVYRLL